jgi:hypothetical protein
MPSAGIGSFLSDMMEDWEWFRLISKNRSVAMA